MPHYELIFEGGESSIANYADDNEALSAIAAGNEKAGAGALIHNSWSATERPFFQERVVRVLVFEAHPSDLAPEDGSNPDGKAAVRVAGAPANASNYNVLPERELELPASANAAAKEE